MPRSGFTVATRRHKQAVVSELRLQPLLTNPLGCWSCAVQIGVLTESAKPAGCATLSLQVTRQAPLFMLVTCNLVDHPLCCQSCGIQIGVLTRGAEPAIVCQFELTSPGASHSLHSIRQTPLLCPSYGDFHLLYHLQMLACYCLVSE